MHRSFRPLVLATAVLMLAACQLPITDKFNSPQDANAPGNKPGGGGQATVGLTATLPTSPTVSIVASGFTLGATFTVSGGTRGSLSASCTDTGATFQGWYKDSVLDSSFTNEAGYSVDSVAYPVGGFHSVLAMYLSGGQKVSSTVYFKTN